MEFEIKSKKYGIHKVLIDDEDYEKIKIYKWYLAFSKGKIVSIRATICNKDNKRKTLYLHNFLSGNSYTDHKDRNVLNNSKQNLRQSTKSENARNRYKQINNKSGYKGVSWNNNCKKWVSQIQINSKKHYIGLFFNVQDAAKAYNQAAIKYHGEFACLNKI